MLLRLPCLAAARRVFEGQALVGLTAHINLNRPPHVELAIEGGHSGFSVGESQASAMDRALRDANVEYDSKRKSQRLGPTTIRVLPPGSYARYRLARAKDGAPDAQVKDLVIAWRDEDWTRLMDAALG